MRSKIILYILLALLTGTAQLTNLIIYQRAYQADSKAITSIDQMQQTLIALNL